MSKVDEDRQDSKSKAYFGLIRNYYRFGWLIPYFFGASPALCGSFIQGRETKLPFESIGGTLYLPHATSLRLSDLGYTNSAQSALKIGFNSLDEYLEGLNKAIRTPSPEFAEIGVKVEGGSIVSLIAMYSRSKMSFMRQFVPSVWLSQAKNHQKH